MFLSNRYTTIYFNIVNKAKMQHRKKGDCYYENHHIIPRSLGGDNKKNNLVLLTAKEHFICHLVLVRMTEGLDKQKMVWAMWNLSNVPGNSSQHRYRLSSRTFETVRKIYSKNTKGKKRPEHLRPQMIENMNKYRSIRYGEDNHEFKGYYHTPWGKFATAQEAADNGPGLHRKRIPVACKDNETILKIRKPITLPKEWIGKTYKELGFWFEEVRVDCQPRISP